jgi:hypothetical protein
VSGRELQSLEQYRLVADREVVHLTHRSELAALDTQRFAGIVGELAAADAELD